MEDNNFLKAKDLKNRIEQLKFVRLSLVGMFENKPFSIEIAARFINVGIHQPVNIFNNVKSTVPNLALEKQDIECIYLAIDARIKELETEFKNL